MKQLLDTFARWGVFLFTTVLFALGILYFFIEMRGDPWFVKLALKVTGVVAFLLSVFFLYVGISDKVFPTSVLKFFAYMREHANTEDE